jgi:hypothetical protein
MADTRALIKTRAFKFKPRSRHLAVVPLLFYVLAQKVSGQPTPQEVDKSVYHLFSPTPRALMREMNTDRPDKTESPYTVDAGHVQLEMDFVAYTHDRNTAAGANTSSDAFAIAPVNLKAGLLNSVDLQLVIGTYNRVRTADRSAGTIQRQSGFGDVTLRLKKNFWGNDRGESAFGMMPFVTIPASQDNLGNNAVEGGLIFPLDVKLPHGWGMGAMTEFDLLQNTDASGYHASFVNSVTFSHDIAGKLGGYMEFFSEVSAERNSDWIGTVDFGLTYGLTANLQLDAGVNFGVTRAADDINTFIGISVRY